MFLPGWVWLMPHRKHQALVYKSQRDGWGKNCRALDCLNFEDTYTSSNSMNLLELFSALSDLAQTIQLGWEPWGLSLSFCCIVTSRCFLIFFPRSNLWACRQQLFLLVNSSGLENAVLFEEVCHCVPSAFKCICERVRSTLYLCHYCR